MADRKAISPVRRLKLSDTVAADLERMILRGDYEVDERLPTERDLAAQFGVGRSSMREALRLVEAAGLIRIEHGVGVFVQSNQKGPLHGGAELLVLGGITVPELFEVRLPLEREAAALAARRVTPDEAAELMSLVHRCGDEGLANSDFVLLDADLHRAIVRASKNRLLANIYEGIEPLFVAYSERVIGLEGRRKVAHGDHQVIVDAIVSRRPKQARDAMVHHIREVERDIREQLERYDSPESPPVS